MAKKKDVRIRIVGGVACVLGIVAFCLMFATAVNFNGSLSGALALIAPDLESFTGSELVFGCSLGEIEILQFNFVALLAFLLPLVGGVLALLFKNGLITKIVTTGCFVAGAVLLFCLTTYMSVGFLSPEGIDGTFLEDLYDAISGQFALSGGAIAAGVISIVGAVLCFFKGTIAKLFAK